MLIREKPFLFRSLIYIFVYSLLAASLAFGGPFPGDSKIADRSVISSVSGGEHQGLIVIFDDAEASEKAAAMRGRSRSDHDTPDIFMAKAALRRALKTEVKKNFTEQEVEPLRDYSHLPAMFVKVKSLKGLKKLAAHAGIKGIYRNRAFRYFLAESLPLIGQPEAAAHGYTGAGASVAVLDTGVDYTDPAFGSCAANTPGDCLSLPAAPTGCRIACVHDFAVNDYALDDDGHGTNVSGIVAGVAPDANMVNLDIFEQDGYAYSDTIINAINWVIANKSAYNIVAMNMSFGGDFSSMPCTQDEFASPIAEARSAGILSAVASGNERRKNAIASPACVPAAVSVGAVYDADLGPINWGICRDAATAPDQTTCFSNSANFLTLLAPGSEITSGGWIMSGTSQATPHVAGAIAVLRGNNAFPAETVDETVNRLVITGVPVTDPVNGITKPRINLSAATGELPVGTFPGIAPTFAISGYVKTAANTALSGVQVSLSGITVRSTTTAPDGSYLFSDLPNGSYIVTPMQTGYAFIASPRGVMISSSDVTGVNFMRGLNIAGSITTSGLSPLTRVKVTLSGPSSSETQTDSAGKYVFTGLAAGTYRVTPSKLTFTFSPVSTSVMLGSSDSLSIHFRARTYSISGTIKTSSGRAMQGVVVQVTGCDVTKTATTSKKGKYTATDLPTCSNYSVTPVRSGYSFTPLNRTIAVKNANVSKADFRSQ